MASKKKSSVLLRLLIASFALVAFYVIFFYSDKTKINEARKKLFNIEERYGKKIDIASKKFQVHPSYLKSLIMLESSGRDNIPGRFEPHVYEKLKRVKKKHFATYESITHKMVEKISDDSLKLLASSWGPFQIMGYKTLFLNITIDELKGKDAIYWGTKWISINYGKLLRKKKYKDAFHYHNTGKLFPGDGTSRTHNPEYVYKGLKYMEFFDSLSVAKTKKSKIIFKK